MSRICRCARSGTTSPADRFDSRGTASDRWMGVSALGGHYARPRVIDEDCVIVSARCARVHRMVDVRLVEVDADNWEACAALRVDEEDRRWVADDNCRLGARYTWQRQKRPPPL